MPDVEGVESLCGSYELTNTSSRIYMRSRCQSQADDRVEAITPLGLPTAICTEGIWNRKDSEFKTVNQAAVGWKLRSFKTTSLPPCWQTLCAVNKFRNSLARRTRTSQAEQPGEKTLLKLFRRRSDLLTRWIRPQTGHQRDGKCEIHGKAPAEKAQPAASRCGSADPRTRCGAVGDVCTKF